MTTQQEDVDPRFDLTTRSGREGYREWLQQVLSESAATWDPASQLSGLSFDEYFEPQLSGGFLYDSGARAGDPIATADDRAASIYEEVRDEVVAFDGIVELYSWGGRQLFVDLTNEFVVDFYDASTEPFEKDARLWTIEWGPEDVPENGSHMQSLPYEEFSFDEAKLLARYEYGEVTEQ